MTGTGKDGADQAPAGRGKVWLRVAIYIAGAYGLWCGGLYWFQDKMVFPRDLAAAPLPRPADPNTIVTWLEIEEGEKVEAWFLPAPNARAGKLGPAVIFFHGNAELIDFQDFVVEGYHRLGCSVLLPEYRGYGRSGGKPSENAIIDDAVRFYDVLIRRPEVDATRVAIHGSSMGGGVAAGLAARRRPRALILEKTFTSIAAMARKFGAPAFLARHPFRTDRIVSKIDAPLLIFHGTRDSIVPVSHGRRLRELASDAVYREYDCGHNDFPGPANEKQYWAEVETFLIDSGVLEGPEQ